METDPLPTLAAITWDIQLNPFTSGIALSLAIILILLICSALISGSEIACFSLSQAEKNKIAERSARQNHYLHKNLKSPEQLLATILVANNFIYVGIVILSSFTFNSLFNFTNEPGLSFILQILIISFLILLVGEIIPKVYSTSHSLRVARFTAIPLYYLIKIFWPLNSILIFSTSLSITVFTPTTNTFRSINCRMRLN